MMPLILSLLLAYLLGSIPFGLLLTKAAGMGDIRNMGSGNIGATNVLRSGNKKLALLTLLLDGGKGWLGVYFTHYLIPQHEVPPNQAGMLFAFPASLLCPFFAVAGHVFPIWLKFKGGKGVATAIGTLFGLFWWLGMIAMSAWLSVFIARRISSLSALVTFSLMPFVPLIIFGGEGGIYTASLLPVSMLVIYRHKENIRRLLAGTEPKFGKMKAQDKT